MKNAELKSRIKSVNARITTVQKIYGKESGIFKRIISTIQKAGGNTRFKYSMFTGNLRQLNKAYNALNTIESSAYLTKEGRKKIGDEARKTFGVNHSGYSDITLSRIFDVFKNSSFARFNELYNQSSELFVDEIMNALEYDGLSNTDMSDAVNTFLNNLYTFDSGRNLNNAVENFRDWLAFIGDLNENGEYTNIDEAFEKWVEFND